MDENSGLAGRTTSHDPVVPQTVVASGIELVKPGPVDGVHPARNGIVDAGDVYERVRQRFIATVNCATSDDLSSAVPATPEWSIHDVLAHVVGLATDLNAQRFPDFNDVGGSAWAARQVEARRGTVVADIIAEWTTQAPRFEQGLRLFGYGEGCHFVADLHAHHQDVCGALGSPRDDDPVTVGIALDHYLGHLDGLLRAAKWGTLEVTAGDVTRRLGIDRDHRAQVCGSAFEVLRTFSARRSEDQIRRLRWDGDLDSLLAFLRLGFTGGYSIPEMDLVE